MTLTAKKPPNQPPPPPPPPPPGPGAKLLQACPFLPFSWTAKRPVDSTDTCRLPVHKYAIFLMYTHTSMYKKIFKVCANRSPSPPTPSFSRPQINICCSLTSPPLLLLFPPFLHTLLFFHHARGRAPPQPHPYGQGRGTQTRRRYADKPRTARRT